MKSMLIIFLLLSTFWVKSQSPAKQAIEPEESINIKLARFPIADFPKKSIIVSDIRIIQMVRDSVRMGYALKGMDNYVVTLKITKPLTTFLQDHIYRMYKHEFKKEGLKILLVLKDIRMGEKTGLMEYSYGGFNMDAYISGNGELYKKACNLDTVFVTEMSSDVSKWHGEDIENAFRILVKRTLVVAKNTTGLAAEEMTINQIIAQPYHDLNLPILNETLYNEGAYANFEEFLENKPSIANYEPVLVNKKRIKFISRHQDNNADTINIWGICKDGEIYKYHEESLIPIEKQGTGFIISNFIKNSNRRNRNLVLLSMMGGLASGLAVGIAIDLVTNAKNKLLFVKSIPYITNPFKQPVASCINMKTGQVGF